MTDAEHSTSGMVPGLVQEFMAQVRGIKPTAPYTVSTRPPHDLHTVSTPSGFGRLLRHIGWPVSDVLIKQLGSDKRYRGHAAGEGGMS